MDSDYLFGDCSQRVVSRFGCGKSSVIKQTLETQSEDTSATRDPPKEACVCASGGRRNGGGRPGKPGSYSRGGREDVPLGEPAVSPAPDLPSISQGCLGELVIKGPRQIDGTR